MVRQLFVMPFRRQSLISTKSSQRSDRNKVPYCADTNFPTGRKRNGLPKSQCVVSKIELPDHPRSRTVFSIRSVPSQWAGWVYDRSAGNVDSTRPCSLTLKRHRSVLLDLSLSSIILRPRSTLRPPL